MKKWIAMFMVLLLLCTNGLAEGVEPRNSNYFHSYGTTMGPVGNGVLSITFSVVGMGICSQLGVATYEVQKLKDGDWVDISETLSGELGTNVASYTFGRYFYGVAGETYRVKATFFCSLGNGVEHKPYTSTDVTVY